MQPAIIHRYRFSTAEVVEALGIAQDCAGWTISVDPGGVVVDIVEPGSPPPEPPPSIEPTIEDVVSLPSATEAPGPEPELKGGPLAQRAAIWCGEPGFRTFLGVRTADDARADILRRCGVTSRKMLDHDAHAAEIWRDIDGKYRLWLEGHDVEI